MAIIKHTKCGHEYSTEKPPFKCPMCQIEQLNEMKELLVNLYNINKFPDKDASLVYIQARNLINKFQGEEK